eukprot:TRINITY_DN17801_c0_g1_i1.p1 TRINITY_DN17801_c0_g1~~TRINITY_DN17801_c0_g1_i1.p1  ORF type:complete len:241 (-),score=43.87 TRINITY_DN17801_c0_g1_i1:20-661(-)
MSAIVGLAVFTQFWYWHPLVYFASLAFTPTHFIGLNSKLEMPVYSFKSNARPSLFAYPPLYKQKEEEKVEKVSTAVLSITKKKEKRDKKKKGKDDQMEVEDEEKKKKDEEDKKKKEDEDKKKEDEKEPDFEIKENPARVLPAQTRYLTFDNNSRYELIKTREIGGIIMLKDLRPKEDEQTVSFKSGTSTSAQTPANEPDAPMPESFEYDPDKE